jgi:hypothetical protein
VIAPCVMLVDVPILVIYLVISQSGRAFFKSVIPDHRRIAIIGSPTYRPCINPRCASTVTSVRHFPSVRAQHISTILTAVAVRRDEIDPDLVHCDPVGLLIKDAPDEADLVFHYGNPCAVLPVLHRGRIVLARWGCRRNESRVLPCTGWTTTRSTAASRFWRRVDGVAVLVPASWGLRAARG